MVLADIRSASEDSNTHNLGKSLLLDVIDFCLLTELKKDHWLVTTQDADNNQLFEDYVFFLEVFLNSGQFLTIRRSVAHPTKIGFEIKEKRRNGFIIFDPPEKEKVTFAEAKRLLNAYLDFEFFAHGSYDFRKSLGYCLRRQGDYDDLFQLNRFVGRHVYWKPFVFDLLGFNGKLLEEKLETDHQIEKKKEYIQEQQKELEIDLNEKDKLVGQIQLKTSEKSKIETELNSLNFYDYDSESIKQADKIEYEISILNSELFRIEFDLRKLESSIENIPDFDSKWIREVFEEAKVYFPDNLSRSYEELEDFDRRLVSERNDLLRKQIESRRKDEVAVRKSLLELNASKGRLSQLIQSESILEKLKSYQAQLNGLEKDLGRLEVKLDAFDVIDKRYKELNDLKERAKDLGEELREIANTTIENKFYMSIRKTFAELVKEVLAATAVISINTNLSGNIDFSYEIDRDEQITAEDRGFTYRKLLCIAFDLSILITYRSESYYRFVYHDDVFANEDNRIKLRLLSAIRRICLDSDIQYIFSVIKDELPKDENGRSVEFSDEEIILRLDDRDDDGKLFLRSF